MEHKKKINFATNFWFNNYLSNIDLVYKYNFKNKYQIPSINKITLSLNLNEISILDSNKKIINSIQNYRNIFFFIFCLFLNIPYIKAKTIFSSQGSHKNSESEYILKLQFISTIQINQFLFFFFIEHWNSIIKKGIKTKIKTPKTLQSNLNIKIPLNILYNFDTFYNNQIQLIKEDTFIFVDFKFNNLTLKNYNTIIKNLPLFWKYD